MKLLIISCLFLCGLTQVMVESEVGDQLEIEVSRKIPTTILNGLACTRHKHCNIPHEICHSEREECSHVGLFPIEHAEGLGLLFTGITLAFSNAGGVGGGEVLVPLQKFMFEFNAKEAVPICQWIIFIGCFTRFFFSYSKRHPDSPDKVIIDYN